MNLGRKFLSRTQFLGVGALLAFGLLTPVSSLAQETICARVKIEIKQELTLERQAFDAEMKIHNTTDAGVIENVSVVVKVTDELGTPVPVSDNPNDLSARFFVRASSVKDLGNVTGTGSVAAKTTGIANWLLIPAPASSGNTVAGKKYLVGATLKYRYLGEDTTLEVSPDVITVKPLPLLTLDYFLPTDVWADDPLTPAVEAVEPFTLGVRVRNNGVATAKNLKIDSAQPKIVENNQGLLIGFTITGSYVDDTPAQNSLLIDFGEIAANRSKMGRWVMETTLAGKFTEFAARYTHADELGGALTSLLQATNAHTLLRDVRVDLPGRDQVRDFLAQDGDAIRVYESDSTDSVVTDRSAVAAFTSVSSTGDVANYALSFPATDGFAYVKLVDPFSGTKQPSRILRSDGKLLLPENVWFSKTRDKATKQWSYFVNFFDVNTTGVYQAEFQPPAPGSQLPVLQFIPDRVVAEGRQVSFLVEASSPAGVPVALSAAPLPAGAVFVPQPADPAAPGLARAVFDWTPAVGQAGSYLITYTANDGVLSATRSATIKVETNTAPSGPGAPAIAAPLSGSQVTTLQPTLSAQASTAAQDPTTQLQFELYADAGLTQLVASTELPKAADGPGNGGGSVQQPTAWKLPSALSDNTHYWWRVRAFDGSTYSLWTNARFFVNLFNDPPDRFNLLLPVPGGEVAEAQPTLSWANAVDKDGDAVSYGARVFADAALSQLVTSVDGLPADASGTTSWQVNPLLSARRQYFWRVIATDAAGAQTVSAARAFFTGVGNTAPTAPGLASPAPGANVPSFDVALVLNNATDADGDLITYLVELDTSPSFDSGAKRSDQLIQGAGQTTTWAVTGLKENTRYHWRAKAQDGRAESAWAGSSFFVNTVNEPPSQPTVRNPGNGAWVAALAPVLELNPATDPEGQALRYEFQISQDSGFAQVLRAGLSDTPSWQVPSLLTDRTTYWWRARAVDADQAVSNWTAASVMYVSTGDYQNPSIHMLSPAVPTAPSLRPDGSKFVTLAWEGADLNIEPTVALYHASSKAGFNGTLIIDGLKQAAGTHAGRYEWDVSSLPVGAYHVYAVIYDSRGSSQAWAPGAVVATPASQSGSIVVNAATNLQTTEKGGQARFGVKLGSAPSDEVTVPVASSMPGEGQAEPRSLSFSPQNWNVEQQAIVTGQSDCIPDGNRLYQVGVGNASTLDPQYLGLAAAPVQITNVDNAPAWTTTSNNQNVRICGLAVQSQRKVDATTWEYVLEAVFGNAGAGVQGGTARLAGVPALLQVVDAEMQFGALQQGQTGRSLDTVTIRAKAPLSAAYFQAGAGFRWVLSVK